MTVWAASLTAFARATSIGLSSSSSFSMVSNRWFLGSPLHSASLAAPVKECLGQLQASPGQKMTGFITHMAPAYPEQDMEAFADPIKAACKEKGIEYVGCFDCQGFLAEAMHAAVQKKLNMSDGQWADMVKKMIGHPDEEDITNAKAYAKEVLG
jgi:hypothetical protein